MNDQTYAAYEAKLARARQLRAEIMPHNKQVLFDALSKAGIALVSLTFDGVGDSGRMEAPEAFGPDNASLPLPLSPITIKAVDVEAGCAIATDVFVPDYLEELAYDLLGSTHSGWEDNEGAYGEFRFVPAEQSITLEYNERYLDTKLSCHEF